MASEPFMVAALVLVLGSVMSPSKSGLRVDGLPLGDADNDGGRSTRDEGGDGRTRLCASASWASRYWLIVVAYTGAVSSHSDAPNSRHSAHTHSDAPAWARPAPSGERRRIRHLGEGCPATGTVANRRSSTLISYSSDRSGASPGVRSI